jgi:glyoxylase-like metal-dependent hydrolase (beta-lactamase superfamily II)
MRITTLIENKADGKDEYLASEWGLSLHITFNGHDILFDTRASGLFAKNAERLSVNVASVEAAVLSHHHFDHGGQHTRSRRPRKIRAELPGRCDIYWTLYVYEGVWRSQGRDGRAAERDTNGQLF